MINIETVAAEIHKKLELKELTRLAAKHGYILCPQT